MKKVKIPLLYALSFICSISPILTFFLINHREYISTTPEKIKLLFGGALVVSILIIKSLGFLKIKSSLVFFGGAFLLSYLLESIIHDLLIFSFLALVGEVLAMVVKIFINRERKKIEQEKSGQIVKEAIKEVSGRV